MTRSVLCRYTLRTSHILYINQQPHYMQWQGNNTVLTHILMEIKEFKLQYHCTRNGLSSLWDFIIKRACSSRQQRWHMYVLLLECYVSTLKYAIVRSSYSTDFGGAEARIIQSKNMVNIYIGIVLANVWWWNNRFVISHGMNILLLTI